MPSLRATLRLAERLEAERIAGILEGHFLDDGVPVSLFRHGADWVVDLYFHGLETDAAGDAIRDALGSDAFGITPQIRSLDDTDWVAASLEGLGAVRAGRFVVHGVHARDAVRVGDISLWIEAGAAFGTGHHGTTLGCLNALIDHLKRRKVIHALDVGTGTGVLAIALAKACRSARIIATDLDPTSVRIARENAGLNHVGSRIRVLEADGLSSPRVRQGAQADLIFANILAGPLVHLAPQIARAVAPGGAVILSGLLIEQERQVLAAYRARGLQVKARRWIDGWSTLTLERP